MITGASNLERRSAAEEILRAAISKGVRLWTEAGKLRYRGPAGVLTQDDVGRLRDFKDEILFLLSEDDCRGSNSSTSARPSECQYAPLTFSQLAHWNLHELERRPSSRNVAYAVRLIGDLDVVSLRGSIEETVRRHEALRTQIVRVNGLPMQEIRPQAGNVYREQMLPMSDARNLKRDIDEAITRVLTEQIDVAINPLTCVTLLIINKSEHVLVVAMEHSIADGYSLNVLLQDIFDIYALVRNNVVSNQQERPLQFAEYAQWLHQVWAISLENKKAHWDQHFLGCRRVRFPSDKQLDKNAVRGWGVVSFQMRAEFVLNLDAFCKSRQITIVTCIFAIYVVLAMDWCRAPDAVFQFQTDGRTPKTVKSIGFFSSLLYLRMRTDFSECFDSLLKQLTREYCAAAENADLCYLLTETPLRAFVHNTVFNWIPQSASALDLSQTDKTGVLSSEPVYFTPPNLELMTLDNEPIVVMFRERELLKGHVYFSKANLLASSMEKFALMFGALAERLIENPLQAIGSVCLDARAKFGVVDFGDVAVIS